MVLGPVSFLYNVGDVTLEVVGAILAIFLTVAGSVYSYKTFKKVSLIFFLLKVINICDLFVLLLLIFLKSVTAIMIIHFLSKQNKRKLNYFICYIVLLLVIVKFPFLFYTLH